ncbi:MAG: ABC transporter substrate-binding protein [Deltaproteobacteria bacterium]|nr:MAG: ABC transporter substrate-binding protein [Deltaproteobacteria bacterium]
MLCCRRFPIIAFLLLLAFWGYATFSVAATIRIGEINPLSGRLAKQGVEIHQGVAVAVAEVNEAGGLDGRQVEIISRDDQSQPDVAISRAEELCGWKKVLALTGGYVDSLVGPISEVAKKYQVPYVASASLQKDLTQRGNHYFFRVAKIKGFVEPLCSMLADHVHPQRLAILHAATPGSTEFSRDLRGCLQSRGIAVMLMEKFRPGTPDFTPLIGKLANMNIEVIISGGFFADHLLLLRQLKENRVSPKAYIGPFGIAYESFIGEMGDDAEYLYSTCAWHPGITNPGTEAASKDFVERFRSMFHREPNTTNMHGYTSARVVLAAIQNVVHQKKPLTGPNIRQSLAELDLALPMERVAFDNHGDPRHYQHLVVQIQKGKFEVIYPPERTTASAIYPMPTWGQRK